MEFDRTRATIRNEQSSEAETIRKVICAAFPTPAEADLVEALRLNGNLSVSLVATENSEVLGHIGFSPVSIQDCDSANSIVGVGLAPIAVIPSRQKRGIGGQLIGAGLIACRGSQIDYVVVLGEPEYYQRFGFATASVFGLRNEFGVDAEFMVIELAEHCLTAVSGTVQFSSEFQAFS